MLASRNGHVDVVRELLKHDKLGVNVSDDGNATDEWGSTSPTRASSKVHLDMVCDWTYSPPQRNTTSTDLCWTIPRVVVAKSAGKLQASHTRISRMLLPSFHRLRTTEYQGKDCLLLENGGRMFTIGYHAS